MAFLSRKLGDVVTVPLADESPTEEMAEALADAGVEVDIAMISGELRDSWAMAAVALDKANKVELRDELACWEAEPESERGEKPEYASGAPQRYRQWSLEILEGALRGLRGWHDDFDTVTDGRALGVEIDAYSQALAVGLARRCMSEQLPSARQGKS